MRAATKIKDAAVTGAKTIRAAKGESQAAAQLRQQLGILAAFAAVASTFGYLAFRAARCASDKAKEHYDWQEKDKQLDNDLEDTLDASDPVARY